MSFAEDLPDSLEPKRSMKRDTMTRMSLDGRAKLIIHIGPMSFGQLRRCRSDSGSGMTEANRSSWTADRSKRCRYESTNDMGTGFRILDRDPDTCGNAGEMGHRETDQVLHRSNDIQHSTRFKWRIILDRSS